MRTFRYLMAAGISTTLAFGVLKPGFSQTHRLTDRVGSQLAATERSHTQQDSSTIAASIPALQETLAPSRKPQQQSIEAQPNRSSQARFPNGETQPFEDAAGFMQSSPAIPASTPSTSTPSASTPSASTPQPAPLATALRAKLNTATLAQNNQPSSVPKVAPAEMAPANPNTGPAEAIDPDALAPDSTSAVDLAPKEYEPAPESLSPDPNPLLFPTQSDEVKLQGTQPITLQQALELAQRNSDSLRIAQLQRDRSRDALREAQAVWYPTFSLNSDITRQQTASGGLQARRSGGAGGGFASLFNTGGQAFDAPSSAFSTTVEGTYNIYTSGNRSASVRLAEKQLRIAELEVEQIAEQLRLDITNAYYDLQEADESVRIANADVENATKSLTDAQALERAGLGTRFDVLQAEVELANSQQTLAQNISQRSTSRRNIARLLNLPQTLDVSAADPVEKAGGWTLSLEKSIILAFKNRAELEQFLLERDSSRHRRRIALSQIGPQINIFANYNLLDLFEDDENFADGYTIGVRLRWEFFDGGAAEARAKQENKNRAIAELNFEDQRNTVRFEVEQAYYDLQFNAKNIGTATKALEQAKEALRLARLRFQAGVGIQLDVLDAQAELTRAEGNLVSAILGYNRALASIQRAISNLPDSDLSDLTE